MPVCQSSDPWRAQPEECDPFRERHSLSPHHCGEAAQSHKLFFYLILTGQARIKAVFYRVTNLDFSTIGMLWVQQVIPFKGDDD